MRASSIRLAVSILSLALALGAALASERSAAARYQFRKLNPCPATQSRHGPCPGYVMDHIIPLCAGGADHPDNMQWQTSEAAKLKDSEERKSCRK